MSGGRLAQRAASTRSATAPCSLTHVPLSWNGELWPFRHPLDYVGSDGGGGVGGGPGISVGAALALKGSRPHADRGLRRRRLHDGRHRALDRGALPHSDAVRGRQQSLVLQRRGASGARRAHAQPAGREQVDRPAHQPIRTSTSPRSRARRARRASVRVEDAGELGEGASPRRSRWSKRGGVAVVDVRVARPGYSAAPMTAAVRREWRRSAKRRDPRGPRSPLKGRPVAARCLIAQRTPIAPVARSSRTSSSGSRRRTAS